LLVYAMDVMQELEIYKKIVDSELEKFFDSKIEEIGDPNDPYSKVTSFLKDYTLRGGKRIRPAFTYYSYLLFAEADSCLDDVIKASIAHELKQAYYLIHDDITDKSDERRGGPSMHKMLEEWYMQQKDISVEDAKYMGISMAIFVGDQANAFAYEAITQTKLSKEKRFDVIEILNDTDLDTLHGQVLDIQSGITQKMSTEEEFLNIHELKSAIYTIRSPLLIGAMLAGASEEEQKILSDYALPLGQAFQLQDDILGLFGNEKKLGKPASSDLAEGKKTLLMIKALENAKHSEKRIINECLGNPNITESMVKQVQDIVRNTGSLDYSVNLAKDLISESKEYLNQLENVNPDAKEFLLAFADYMLDREH
ncbi:MAG: polyprenyl synthetase family protein, partial [Candidatus Aenigmarchaeota archaeon]|nr:polyprenyl synthetase family protein [Candidatus Aenigmarchaeota archaeon]